MGRGPKHSSKSRNNGIFKVAGQNFKVKDKKGKPKEVTSKLKLVRAFTRFTHQNIIIYPTSFLDLETE